VKIEKPQSRLQEPGSSDSVSLKTGNLHMRIPVVSTTGQTGTDRRGLTGRLLVSYLKQNVSTKSLR